MAYKLVGGASRENAMTVYTCDTIADMATVLAERAPTPLQTACYVVADGSTYILNSANAWVVQPNA